jgi:hypothetical protein
MACAAVGGGFVSSVKVRLHGDDSPRACYSGRQCHGQHIVTQVSADAYFDQDACQKKLIGLLSVSSKQY